MEQWIAAAIGLLVGALCGFAAARMGRGKEYIGNLRMDQSDPNEAPYFFLELDPDGMKKIYGRKTVALHVRIENFIPRK